MLICALPIVWEFESATCACFGLGRIILVSTVDYRSLNRYISIIVFIFVTYASEYQHTSCEFACGRDERMLDEDAALEWKCPG